MPCPVPGSQMVAPSPAHRIKPYLGFGVPIGSAYLSARRTFGRPKVRFNPSPPLVLAEKMAGSPAVPSAGRRYGLIRHPPL